MVHNASLCTARNRLDNPPISQHLFCAAASSACSVVNVGFRHSQYYLWQTVSGSVSLAVITVNAECEHLLH